MRKIFLLLLLQLFLFPNLSSALELEEQTLLLVESYLKKKEAESKAYVYRKANRFMKGDMNYDNIDDLALLYTLEGVNEGNNYFFYLVVFIKTDKGYRFQAEALAGQIAARSVSFDSIEDGIIQLSTKFMTKKADGLWDPICCPSGIGKAYYTLNGEKLTELNRSEMPFQ